MKLIIENRGIWYILSFFLLILMEISFRFRLFNISGEEEEDVDDKDKEVKYNFFDFINDIY